MTEAIPGPRADPRARTSTRLRQRYAAERRFKAYGALAIVLAMLALAVLLASIVGRGYGAFVQHVVRLEVAFDLEVLGIDGVSDARALATADYTAAVRTSLRARFPNVTSRSEKRSLYQIVSSGAGYELRRLVSADPSLLGETVSVDVPLADDIDLLLKGQISREVEEDERRVNDAQIAWVDALQADGCIASVFNSRFLVSGDSREPELAGIGGALLGSLWTLGVTLLLCFPVGVAAAIHLEEFARKNRITDFVEVNINNLAAVPSIVFGLLGLAVFLNFAGLPRSAPLVGGLVLALMTLPTIIIASRSALAAVPPSIREGAMGVGASPIQVVGHHVLPLAMPGILTGTIIGMARALGETAPLLMIGMVAFIVDLPTGPTSPATVLPVQVFLWADSPERAFVEKTSAAILVLLVFLVTMNLAAVLMRNRFERRW